jgi:hypothetical protein
MNRTISSLSRRSDTVIPLHEHMYVVSEPVDEVLAMYASLSFAFQP